MNNTVLPVAALLASSLLAQGLPHPTASAPTSVATPSLPKTVVFDRPEAGGEVWALGHGWKAAFDGRGCTVVPFFGSLAPRNYPLRIELAQVTVGGHALELVDGEPVVAADSVRTARGPLVEVVDTRLHELEQSFVFAALPNRGDIVVHLTIATELGCTSLPDGLAFANELGRVTYRHAVAVDARGARLPVAIARSEDGTRITIPAAFVAQAVLPLVLDPVLQFQSGYAPGETQLQRDADIMTLQLGYRSCIVWRRQWSVADQDCFGVVVDANLAPLTPVIPIDFTANSWSAPAVAGSYHVQSFVVVSQVDYGSTSWIAGRLVGLGGAMNPQFVVEGAGIGLAGNNLRPDIGGDPYPGAAAFYTVVFEHETSPGNHDIYYKQLNQDGSLRTVNPQLLDGSPANESNPAIGKSNWQGNWFLVWQRTYSPIDEDLVGAQVGFSGSLVVGPHYVAVSSRNETQPAISSPAFLGGNRYALAVWQTDFNGDHDITCRVIDANGGLHAYTNLSQVEAGGLYQIWNQIQPDVDSDGSRFVVCSAEQYGGFTYDTRATTVAYLPGPDTLRLDEQHVLLGGSPFDELQPRICADFSGGSLLSSRYVVVGPNHGANDIEAHAYGGYQAGAWFTTRATQCGSLSLAASGAPLPGQPVTFTAGGGALSGTILGFPGTVPLNGLGCNCSLGVANGLLSGNPLVWTIPANVAYVGTTLSVQGFTISGNQCLGFLDLSDTIDFTIR